jgi:hypothetical protein
MEKVQGRGQQNDRDLDLSRSETGKTHWGP